MKIALTGNPNSGKTTMYNALTGRNERVGNWAGVTVEKMEHTVRRALTGGRDIIAVDLPGAYSMSPFTSEESITSDYVKKERPDVILNIVDGTNLSRSLFFTTQLLELGIPVVVALNKTDVNERKETVIDASALSSALKCPVVQTVSTKGIGLKKLIKECIASVGKQQAAPVVLAGYTDRAGAEAADRARFAFVNRIVGAVEKRRIQTRELNAQDKIDGILTNRWFGIPIFALVMLLVFMISQWEFGPGVLLADLLVGWMELGQEAIAAAIGTESIWSSILVDGIIGGVIAVVGFLPLVMVMYFLIALLEDCGYMARAAVVLDPIFKKVGLSGKSVIPFIIGTGCAIPGVMACRTIKDERERRATAMLAPFMPCGAKLPVIALFAGVFFGDSPWMGALMYFVGILTILLGAFVVNLITGDGRKHHYFILELPEYKLPSLPRAAASMCRRGWSYIVKAGTIILVCNFLVHLMQNFGWNLQLVENPDQSILATVASPFAYLFAPIVGYVSWQLAAAVITGFIAKENVVGTLAVCFGITNLINPDELILESGANVSAIHAAFGTGSSIGVMLPVAALAYMMFNLFSPPCFAAIGAMRAEMKSKKWLFAGVGLQLGMGYSLSFIVYFFGTLFSGSRFGDVWTLALGWAVVACFVSVLSILAVCHKRRLAQESAEHSDECKRVGV